MRSVPNNLLNDSSFEARNTDKLCAPRGRYTGSDGEVSKHFVPSQGTKIGI